jgi:type I restriction enzyme S subunit
MAETLFRQWFVEEAGEDWGEITIYDAIDLIGGGTPKTSIPEYWGGKIHWLSGGDITANHKGMVISSEKTITENGLANSSTKLLPKYSMVISARGTVGKYCMLSEPMTFSQSNYGVKPKSPNAYFFTYLLVAYSVDELQSAAYGSVFDTITTNTFKGHSILLPNEDIILDFDREVKPYFQKILKNSRQIRTLQSLRDTLLPKLMSGEIRVVDMSFKQYSDYMGELSSDEIFEGLLGLANVVFSVILLFLFCLFIRKCFFILSFTPVKKWLRSENWWHLFSKQAVP